MRVTLRQRANLLAGAFVFGGVFVYKLSPTEHSFYPRCLFHALTGLQCPGCGATRAFYQLLHLHFQEALHYNALFTVLAPVVLLWFAYWYYSVMRFEHAPEIRMPRTAAVGCCLVALVFAVVRNTGFGL
ncbi:MAG TPA: DUF2752 domain-containing protein [Candidatus Angelobacter sp.]|nr:DUF2752 domain-containing protein [Candidatus Angelobacter sp.]